MALFPRSSGQPCRMQRWPNCRDYYLTSPKGQVLQRYYGYYSNRSRGERRKTAEAAGSNGGTPLDGDLPIAEPEDFSRRDARRRWAELLQRIFEVDPLEYPACGGRMRLMAFILTPRVIDPSTGSCATCARKARIPGLDPGSARPRPSQAPLAEPSHAPDSPPATTLHGERCGCGVISPNHSPPLNAAPRTRPRRPGDQLRCPNSARWPRRHRLITQNGPFAGPSPP